MPWADFDPERIARSPWAAGALGSIVALRWAPGLTWAERAFNVLCGSLCAGYLTPALTEWLHIDPIGIRSAAAFGVGMFGLSIAAEVLRWVRDGGMREAFAQWWPWKRKGGE